MFSTTSHLTDGTDAQTAVVRAITLDDMSVDAELAELRMLTRAGEMHARDAAPLIADLEQRIARRDARRDTLGAAGSVTTFELEAWHGDDRDHESAALRVALQAHGLL